MIANAKTIAIPIVAQEGRGATLTDVDGNVFIDLTGGVGCLNVGHAHPRVSKPHPSRWPASSIPTSRSSRTSRISTRRAAAGAGPVPRSCQGGFLQRGHRGGRERGQVRPPLHRAAGWIAFEGAFHGRTLLSMTLTSRPHPYKVGMGPLAPEVYRAPFPQDYRGPDAETALAELRQLFLTQVAAEQVAAIIIEPVQGEAGFLPAPQRFMEGLRDLRRLRDLPHRRRGTDRLWPHRQAVRDRALRRRARPDHRGEVDRRLSALRRAREAESSTPLTTALSAAPMSATRSRRPRRSLFWT